MAPIIQIVAQKFAEEWIGISSTKFIFPKRSIEERMGDRR